MIKQDCPRTMIQLPYRKIACNSKKVIVGSLNGHHSVGLTKSPDDVKSQYMILK